MAFDSYIERIVNLLEIKGGSVGLEFDLTVCYNRKFFLDRRRPYGTGAASHGSWRHSLPFVWRNDAIYCSRYFHPGPVSVSWGMLLERFHVRSSITTVRRGKDNEVVEKWPRHGETYIRDFRQAEKTGPKKIQENPKILCNNRF